MKTVMIQRGSCGETLPFDGHYLKSFDFEAHDGQGEIELTADLAEAMKFGDPMDAFAFYKRSPACRPLREDGRPNRPLTAANWEFKRI